MAHRKNPRHPHALLMGSLTPGRRIIVFNMTDSTTRHFTVVKRPVAGSLTSTSQHDPTGVGMVILLRERIAQRVVTHYLSLVDMGVIPARIIDDKRYLDTVWSPSYVTVDASKERLLPSPNSPLRANAYDGDYP
ncbi:MAG: hypothetical protein ABIR91_04245 [Candidatus Saccharimonadales bacterium]